MYVVSSLPYSLRQAFPVPERHRGVGLSCELHEQRIGELNASIQVPFRTNALSAWSRDETSTKTALVQDLSVYIDVLEVRTLLASMVSCRQCAGTCTSLGRLQCV